MPQQSLEQLLSRVQKPGRYVGGELNSIHKEPSQVKLRFAFCFPDTYEIGMSHLGMKILYGLLNSRPEIWCERVFAPWTDFDQELSQAGLPLYGLESMDPLSEFHILGFTLQYELSYTTILRMLELGGIPLLSSERAGLKGLVIAGGPCACNPEPLADFIDLFVLGEGEEVTLELAELYMESLRLGDSREAFLQKAAGLEGVYVPSLYDAAYHPDGALASLTPREGAPARVRKRILRELDRAYYPDRFVVPFLDTVHDRVIAEVMRGCVRGCRFCQAGFLYRPLREKAPGTLLRDCRSLCESTGYEEISLSSLSTSDYSQLEPLLSRLTGYTDQNRINLSLPSLRIDNFSRELVEKIAAVRKSGLTFAPEAGTQRLRDVINKGITREDVLDSCAKAFAGGYTSVKLYFMLGLPTETEADLLGILELAQQVVDLYYRTPERPKGKSVSVTVSVSTFVPKPFTPFQYEPQDTLETIDQKHRLLTANIPSRKITLKYHESHASVLEAVLARGDRRLGRVLLTAYRKGCRLDSWEECFRFDLWQEAFAECGLDMAFYASRPRPLEELLPWSHLDYGVSEEFLRRENRLAHRGEITPNCRQSCAGCGAARFGIGVCLEGRENQ